jgi:copper(I)-binding protein
MDRCHRHSARAAGTARGSRAARAARARCLAGAVTAALLLTACGGQVYEAEEWEGPGQNEQIGDVLLRYARLAAPPVDDEPIPAGTDVPLYLWLVNEGQDEDALVSVSTEAAAEVIVVDAGGQQLEFPLPLPPEEDVQLGVDDMHLVALGVEQPLRAGDTIPMTFVFRDAGELTTGVHVQVSVPQD